MFKSNLMFSTLMVAGIAAVGSLVGFSEGIRDITVSEAQAIRGGTVTCYVEGEEKECPDDNFQYITNCNGGNCHNGVCSLTPGLYGEDAGRVASWHEFCESADTGGHDCDSNTVYCINMNVCNGCELGNSGDSVCAPDGRARGGGHEDFFPVGTGCFKGEPG